MITALQEEVGKDFDPFDLILHVAFDQPPLTRRERAQNVRKRNYFTGELETNLERSQEKVERLLEAVLREVLTTSERTLQAA